MLMTDFMLDLMAMPWGVAQFTAVAGTEPLFCWWIWGGVLLLAMLGNAFFTTCEPVLIKVKERQLSDRNVLSAKRLERVKAVLADSDLYLLTCYSGNTISALTVGFVSTYLLATALFTVCAGWHPCVVYGLALAVTVAVLGTGRVILVATLPHAMIHRNPSKAAGRLLPALYVFHTLFRYTGIPSLVHGAASAIMKTVWGIDRASLEAAKHTTDELMYLVEESERSQELTRQEAEISKNALELNDMCVKDIITPRSDVDVLDLTDSFEANWQLARDSRHTRFPLVQGDHLDDVLGWVHVKDLLKLVGQESPDLMSVKRELKVVPDTMPLDSLLTFFLSEHAHFALAVDEFGDSLGLVFLDDVLEQIVGDDIQDEFDLEETHDFIKIGQDTYAVDGTITLFDLADHLPELDLEYPGVTTLGGYVVSHIGHIPKEGESLDLGRYKAVVTGADGRRITQLTLTLQTPHEQAQA